MLQLVLNQNVLKDYPSAPESLFLLATPVFGLSDIRVMQHP
ncbi:hypothetical protein ACW68H_20075 [Vibrio diabolicus]